MSLARFLAHRCRRAPVRDRIRQGSAEQIGERALNIQIVLDNQNEERLHAAPASAPYHRPRTSSHVVGTPTNLSEFGRLSQREGRVSRRSPRSSWMPASATRFQRAILWRPAGVLRVNDIQPAAYPLNALLARPARARTRRIRRSALRGRLNWPSPPWRT